MFSLRRFIFPTICILFIHNLQIFNCAQNGQSAKHFAESWLTSPDGTKPLPKRQNAAAAGSLLWQQMLADVGKIRNSCRILKEFKFKLYKNLNYLVEWFTKSEWKCEELEKGGQGRNRCIQWRALHQSLARWAKFVDYFYYEKVRTSGIIEDKDRKFVAIRPSIREEKDGNIFEIMQKTKEQLEKRGKNEELEPMEFGWTNWLACELLNDWLVVEEEYEKLKGGSEPMVYKIEEYEERVDHFIYSEVNVLIGKKAEYSEQNELLVAVSMTESFNLGMGGKKRGGWSLVPEELLKRNQKGNGKRGEIGLKKEGEKHKMDKNLGEIAEKKDSINKENWKDLDLHENFDEKKSPKSKGGKLNEGNGQVEGDKNIKLKKILEEKENGKMEKIEKIDKKEMEKIRKNSLDLNEKDGNGQQSLSEIQKNGVNNKNEINKEEYGELLEAKGEEGKKNGEMEGERKIEAKNGGGIGHNENGKNEEGKGEGLENGGKMSFKGKEEKIELKGSMNIGPKVQVNKFAKSVPSWSAVEREKAQQRNRERLRVMQSKRTRPTKSFSNVPENQMGEKGTELKELEQTYSQPILKEEREDENKKEINLAKKWKNEKVEKEKKEMERIVEEQANLIRENFGIKGDNDVELVKWTMLRMEVYSAQCPVEGIMEKIRGLPWKVLERWRGIGQNEQPKWMKGWKGVCPGWRELRPKFMKWLKMLSEHSDDALFPKMDNKIEEKRENKDEKMIRLLRGFGQILNEGHTELEAPKWEEMRQNEILEHFCGDGRAKEETQKEIHIEAGGGMRKSGNIDEHKKVENIRKGNVPPLQKQPSKKGAASWQSSFNSVVRWLRTPMRAK